ncbi:MAG: glycosyltransferase, partial [Candidatus Kapaibacteriota bacterium]
SDITIITPVHNEENNLVPLVNSVVNSGYPLSKIQMIFGSDGSTDGTNSQLEELSRMYNFVEYYIFPRSWKNYVLNRLIAKAKNRIVLFLDADIRLEKGTLHKLVSYFSDETIGGVLANVELAQKKISQYTIQDRQFHGFFSKIRKWESDIYATVNGMGPCYAVRRELIPEIPNDRVCDDFFILLEVVSKGKRMVYANDVLAIDVRQRDEVWKEFHRKMRFSAGGISAIFAARRIFRNPWFTFMVISHKLLRWFSPLFLLLAVVLLPFAELSWIKSVGFSIIVVFLLLIIISLLDLKLGARKFTMPMYVVFSFAGTIAGLFRALSGKQNSTWTLERLEN